MGETIEYEGGGTAGQGYLATPTGGTGPGIVVIQEWWGLVDHIREVCDRFAAEGFVALAPDLYHGRTVGEPDEAAKEMMALELERAVSEMSAAVDETASRSNGRGVGVIGFCMGGGLALLLATRRPDAVKAVVTCYGIIPWPDVRPDYSSLTAPVLGHFGEKDEFFPPAAARGLEETLVSEGKVVEIVIHEGADHAFFNDTRPEVYDPEAARVVWESSLAHFRRYLT